MSEEKIELSYFYDHRRHNYHSTTDILRFFLMPFVFMLFLRLPGKIGTYVSFYSNFVTEAFLIIFGFFALVPDSEKRRKKIRSELKQAIKFFAIMFVSYILFNIIYLMYLNSLEYLTSGAFLQKRTIFNFLVLNIWPLPFGNSIWFVQSLVYAYLFFYIGEKIKLYKLYFPIMIILIIFMLVMGEFAAFFGFPHFGYSYIPAGAITRAIPYMLIGMFLRKNVDKLSKIPRFVYLILFPVGLLLAISEIEILNHIGKLVYPGHTIGFGLMALSLCCFALTKPKEYKNFFSKHGAAHSRRMYAYCQPVSLIIWMITFATVPKLFNYINCVVSFVISLILSIIVNRIKKYRYRHSK